MKFDHVRGFRQGILSISSESSLISKTKLKDAVRTAYGMLKGEMVVIASMDFKFIGGSMGSVVGEKIARAIDYSKNNGYPLIIISKSGGARMMEAGISLMQLAKTSAKLAQLDSKKIQYISFNYTLYKYS